MIYDIRGLGGINGINLVATRPDLLDRALLFKLEPIRESRRRTEEDAYSAFERMRPYVLGAMFDALSDAMNSVETVAVTEFPRMADFARWGCAIARAVGSSQSQFLAALGSNTSAQNETAIDNSPVAAAVWRLVEDEGEWSDTPAATLKRLTEVADLMQLDVKGRAWPKQPSQLSRRLNEVTPNLRRVGVEVSISRTNRERRISIRAKGSTVTAVTEAGSAVTGDDERVTGDGTTVSVLVEGDGSDGRDGTSGRCQQDTWEVD